MALLLERWGCRTAVAESIEGAIARLDANDDETPVIGPDGRPTTPAQWFAREDFSRLPALLYVDEAGETVFRTDAVVERLEGVDDPRAEGRRICIDLMQQYAEIPGVAGVHMMAPGQEANIAKAIEDSGVLASR